MTRKVRSWKQLSYWLLVAGTLVLSSCAKPSENESVTVHHVGELREIMHQGKIEARVSLDSLKQKNLYALGAEEDLKGEVTIINGTPYNSRKGNDSTLVVSSESNVKATLLVYSNVLTWDTLSVNSLEEALKILQTSKSASPFMLIGEPQHLKYHVIHFTGKHADKSNHKQGALTGITSEENVQIVGFYSNEHQGIFTHHDSKVHMHFVNDTGKVSGHVDSVEFGNEEFKLLLPKIEVR